VKHPASRQEREGVASRLVLDDKFFLLRLLRLALSLPHC
jgi:hypothetical protein